MTREEAINKVRQMSLPKETMEILEALAPELKESEDERIRKELVEKISNLACGCFISQEQKQNFIAYLEKQKSAEWSEEDEKIIGRLRSVVNECASYNDALDVNGDYCEGDYAKLDAWLKSLRPQSKRDCKDCAMFLNGKCTKPHWKPSEEQMEELQGTITYLAIHNMKVDSLVSLHKDLHKLM